MDPLTMNALAGAAKAGWEIYNKVVRESPGASLQELRARIDAADSLIKYNFNLIDEMGRELATQREHAAKLKVHVAVLYVLSTSSLLFMVYLLVNRMG